MRVLVGLASSTCLAEWHGSHMHTLQAVKAAAACLRGDGVFCSFSPCIEQVGPQAALL